MDNNKLNDVENNDIELENNTNEINESSLENNETNVNSSPDFDFGFIITRHVNSEKTNRYWNRNVKLLRTFYPRKQIVIIDDNSNQSFVKPFHDYKNLITIQSEYPGRGELLPYIYYSRNKWFERAVIMHDSVFFHKRIQFEKFKQFPAISLWHFPPQFFRCHFENNLRIAESLNYSGAIKKMLRSKQVSGCFGVQSFIKYDFLNLIMNKYNINNLVNVVTCREDRCSLERIFAIIFYLELKLIQSVFGDMTSLHIWGKSFDEYINEAPVLPVVKVFTGR